MSQPSSYGTTSNSNLSRSVKQQQQQHQQQQHITQSQARVQNIDMLSYNSSNNNANNGSITVVAESGGNTYAIANSTTTLDQTTSISNQNTNTGAIPKEKSAKNTKQQQPRKPPPTIDTFWPNILQEVQTAIVDSKHQSLPLARIKKIMKLDENAKMIAAEAPTLFAKACEFFIQELTMRAWIHTDESKRRTLQRSDIAQAIANYDQFDFLIDIVPREDIKPPNHRRHHNESATAANNSNSNNASSSNNSPAPMPTATMTAVTGEILNVSGLPVETATATALPTTATLTGNLNQTQPTQMLTTATAATNHATPQLQIIQQAAHPQQHLQYFITLPGQQTGQAQLVHQLQLQQQQQQHINNGLTAASLNLVAQQPQQLILTAANPTTAQAANVVQHQQQTALLQNIAQHQQQQQQQVQQQQHHPQQQVQLLQQVMLTPSGELTNMPIAINANQLNLLRLQMQQQQQHQQQQQQQHHQQVIIPTHLLTAQQLLQLQAQAQNQAQANTAGATTAHIVHHPTHIAQQQHQQHHQQQQTQHHPQTTTPTNNIYINSNTVATNQATANAAASMVSTDRNMGSTFRNNC